MDIPTHLRYTKNDEWISIEGNMGTIGLTDYAQGQLSDIVFVEIIVSAGETLKLGSPCATVESVKAAAEVYTPLSGTVQEINESLPDEPEKINSDPYGEAWFVKIVISDPAELSTLLDATTYEALCKEREG